MLSDLAEAVSCRHCPHCGYRRRPLESDRCRVVDDGEGRLFLMPGCWGTVNGGAAGCYCDPAPRGLAAMIRRDDEERENEKAIARAQAVIDRQKQETWRRAGGKPTLLPSDD